MTDFKECAKRRQPPLPATNDGSQHCLAGQSVCRRCDRLQVVTSRWVQPSPHKRRCRSGLQNKTLSAIACLPKVRSRMLN
jgi:hypothetical protein